MTRKLPKVIVTRKLPDSVETRMCELFDTTLNLDDKKMTQEQLIDAVQSAEVLVPTVNDKIDVDLINKAGDQLKMIASFSNGTDQIDVEAAAKRGIIVTNTPNVLSEDTADMTMGLMVALSRRITEGTKAIENGNWQGWSPTWMLGKRIWGKRLGIVGMGRIGTAVARRAKAFGLSIHYHNIQPADDQTSAELEATYWESLDQMLARMDIISVHCPYTPATYHLLSKRRLALLKPEALLINTARGEVIDEDALITALTDNKIGGAALDFPSYEAGVNPDLMKLSDEGKLVILPHMGSATIEGRIEMGDRVLINIRTFMDGHKPPDRVLPRLA